MYNVYNRWTGTWEYCFPQTKHVKQLEELWTSSCRFRVRLCMYSLPQSAQLYSDSYALPCSPPSSVTSKYIILTSSSSSPSINVIIITFDCYSNGLWLCLTITQTLCRVHINLLTDFSFASNSVQKITNTLWLLKASAHAPTWQTQQMQYRYQFCHTYSAQCILSYHIFLLDDHSFKYCVRTSMCLFR